MNGFIEIYVDGWKRYRWQFTLKDYESFPFEQQVELREADLKQIIDALKENVVPVFDPMRTDFCITYQSKMNNDDTSEILEPEPDEIYHSASRGNDRPADGRGPSSGRCECVNILPG